MSTKSPTGRLKGINESELQSTSLSVEHSVCAHKYWATADFSMLEQRILAGPLAAQEPKKASFPYRFGSASLIAACSVEARSEDRIHRLLLELGYIYDVNTGEYHEA